ncbi:hypothetical protein Tco_0558139 [Tanacetum coccineum]
MMRVTTTFLRGEVAASNRERKKSFPSWKQQEARQKKNFKKGGFRNQQRPKRKQDRFTLLTKTPKEKRNASKFCEFHGEVRHTTDECMHLKRQIEEMLKAGKLSHLIKELKFRLEVKNQMIPTTIPLVRFSGEIIWPLRQISLLVKIGDEEHSTSAWMNFMVVRSPSPYNGIIGRLGTRGAAAHHQPSHKRKDSDGNPPGISGTNYSDRLYFDREGQKELCDLLRRNLDVFAWKPADMTGVPRHIAEHRLNIREGCLLVRQKKRGQTLERNKAIYQEVEKLVDAGIMKEVHYYSWLSNPVMVKKHDNSWWMYVNFKDLNKACPKDGYPLPEIDWKVESLCGYPFKCFLDAYKGFNQIKMEKEDEEKTAFTTSQGIFCY